jgi:hypothetical protein
MQKEQKKLQYQDEIDRIAVEGKFGQGKRRFSLERIMAKLAETSEVVIMVSFIVMNLEKILSSILLFLPGLWLEVYQPFREAIRSLYKEIRKHLGLAIRHTNCDGYTLK